jgi:hypothetical protein
MIGSRTESRKANATDSPASPSGETTNAQPDKGSIRLDDRGFEGTRVVGLEDVRSSWIGAAINFLGSHHPEEAVGLATLAVVAIECYSIATPWLSAVVASTTMAFSVFVLLRTGGRIAEPSSKVERRPQASSLPTTDPGTDDQGVPESASAIPTSLSFFAMQRHADAGLASCVAGLLGAAAFMALSLGPGWAGFIVGFIPVSLLTSWAISSHA